MNNSENIKKMIKASVLASGKTIISKEPGNSMMPLIKSRQPVELIPCTWKDSKVGDIVYCRLGRTYYTHLVKAKNDKRGCLIANNRGHENGWTKNIFGKVTKIL